jgi:hypothetical protein
VGLDKVPDVDEQLTAELNKRWEKDGALFGDVYSACCRPASWEFALPFAATLRELLKQNGYTASTDPDASWRLIWRRLA